VFESNRPWHSDVSLVKVVIAEDDSEPYSPCLALQQLHSSVSLPEDTPIGSVVAQIQLQQLSCQSDVCTNRSFRK